MNISHGHLWLTALIGAAVAAAVVAAAPQLDGPYTAAQVTTGKAIYEQRCADCHRANLEGTGHGPALTGAAFLDVWGSRTAGQLLGFISDSMPPGGSTLGEEEYISVVAYILRSNGHAPGALFDADSMVTVGAPASASNQVAEAASGAPGTQPSEQSESQATNAVLKMRSKSPKKKVQGFTPVTDEMLYHPPASDWLSWRRTLDGQGHSPLDQITRENVSQMRLAWGWTMKNEGSNQTTPLVHDGVMYLVNPGNIVQALDAKTGELIWEYVYTFPRASMVFGGPTRNIAIYRDKLFMSTYDAAIVAIDAKTGTQVWRTVKADYRKGYTQTSGPIIADGVVVSGINGCERFDRDGCFVTGHDPDTGKELWRTSTIALPGDPNTASWGDVPPVLRGGGDTWIAGSYDPELKLFYIGTAQAKPWAAVSRGMSVADAALYTNSTLALDPRTGEMEWYFQHVPGESLDMDMVFERVLVDVNDEKALLTIGKDGILWKIDRRSGEYINLTETVHQDIYEKVDKEAGRVFYRPDIVQAAIGDTLSVCPAAFGGHDWQATAYAPEVSALIIPLHQACGEFTVRGVELVEGSGGWGGTTGPNFEMPGIDGQLGRLVAIDVTTMEPLWVHEQRAMFLSGVVTTAGGLAFVGDADRYIKAFDVKTGEIVWQTRLPSPVHGFPISYAVDGKQFLAVPTGLGLFRAIVGGLMPELYLGDVSNAVYVFELPD